MSSIVQISGKVHFPIVLDPSSWIFDDRKIEYNDFISEKVTIKDVTEKKEERAGAALPRMIERGIKYDKARWITDSFVIPIGPFLKNAEPLEEASTVRFVREGEDDVTVSIETVREGVFIFSNEGKILQEEGPLQFSNLSKYKEAPIKKIKKIVIE
jgi:hypothetical protein